MSQMPRPDVEFHGDQVLIRIPKAILILTKLEFIRALKRGKAFRRAEAQRLRETPTHETSGGGQKGDHADTTTETTEKFDQRRSGPRM